MKTGSRSINRAAISVFFILGVFASQQLFAQCGNYFKTGYRAVDKIRYQNDGYFQLNDWTGDGRLDFWNFRNAAGGASSEIIVYPGKSTGYWDWDNPLVLATPLPAGASANGVAALEDFNTDGRLDFLYNSRIYRNNGNGAFTALSQFTPFQTPIEHIGYFDLNGDGNLDRVDRMNAPNQGNSIAYYLGAADGTFTGPTEIFANVELLNAGKKVVADYNGDGRLDIIYGTLNGYRLLVNNGGNSFTVGNLTPTVNGVPWFVGARDLNGDNRADLIALGGTPRKIVVFSGQANGTFTESAQAVTAPAGDYSLIVELNGDANPDLLESSQTHYTVFINNGGTFAETTYPNGRARLDPRQGMADYSGDGKADFLTAPYNIFGEQVVVVRENVCAAPGGETKIMDFDGNGVGDLVVWDTNNGRWTSQDGVRFFGGNRKFFNWGTSALGDVPSPGDYDGDGTTDYMVYRNSTGVWYGLMSSNSSWLVLPFGLPGDKPVPYDYDGGGKTDIAVWRPSDGNWYIWYTETQTFGALHWGAEGDKPVPEDYDGDGKTDVAVYRPSTGIWYYLRSSDAGFGIHYWGLPADQPRPADYDGDGKADLAQYRDGVWYVLRSNNAYGYLFGGSATDIPVAVKGPDSTNPVFYRPFVRAFYTVNPEYFIASFATGTEVPVNFGLPNN
jgi:hypothetical protein